MPFNTKALKTDMNSKPIPQIFGETSDDFLALTGVDLGNGRAGQDALQWGKTSGGVYVPIQVDANGVIQTNGKQTPYDSSGVEKFTGSNPGSVQLTGRKVDLKKIRNSLTTTISANSSEQTLISPTSGYIGTIRYMGFYSPGISTATTGNQEIMVTVGTDTGYAVERLVDSSVNTSGSLAYNASSNAFPLIGAKFDVNNPLTISWYNNTDVAQTGTRFYVVIYDEEAVI